MSDPKKCDWHHKVNIIIAAIESECLILFVTRRKKFVRKNQDEEELVHKKIWEEG
jgi:hypothetical protein